MQKLRFTLADVAFWIGNTLIILSARLMGYDDTVKDLKKLRIDTWRNRHEFNIKEEK